MLNFKSSSDLRIGTRRPDSRLRLACPQRRQHTASPSAVLIVEDEQSIRDILAELFDAERTMVRAVSSVGEAQAALWERSFDLIVTDIRLQQRRDGGLQVMAAAGLLAPDAVIIALTAFPDDANRDAAERLGASLFLAKPVDLTTLAEMAARYAVATAVFPDPARERAGGEVEGAGSGLSR